MGVIEKLPYLKRLGINAIELLPVHEFNELEYYAVSCTPLHLLFLHQRGCSSYWIFAYDSYLDPPWP